MACIGSRVQIPFGPLIFLISIISDFYNGINVNKELITNHDDRMPVLANHQWVDIDSQDLDDREENQENGCHPNKDLLTLSI